MSTRKENTLLYFAPHQDDELLSMGIHICTSVQKNFNVHVILCSDGSKSNVRARLNNGEKCHIHKELHTFDLSVEEFIQARDNEFIGSCLALGVSPENIHIASNRGVDGSLSATHMEEIVTEYVKKYGPNATVCTLSSNNGPKQHRDHKALGQAVNNLINKNLIRKGIFFVEPYHFKEICDHPRMIPVEPTRFTATGSVAERIQNALQAYRLWDPANQRYAVGYHSVSKEVTDFEKEKTCYFFTRIKPENMSRKERLAFRRSKFLKFKNFSQLYYSLEDCTAPNLGDLELVHVPAKDTKAYKDCCNKYSIKLTDKNLQRIAMGSSFWCLVKDGSEMVSYGWLAYKHHFYIGEPDYDFDMDKSDSAILFDFNTNPEHRGHGYYPLLLQSMVAKSTGPKNYVIYTSLDNKSSYRGIEKAGFKKEGVLKVADNSLKNYLKSQGFTSVKHKYQMGGLRVLP